MKTRSASANSGAQRVVDDIETEPADETLAQVDHGLQPQVDVVDNNSPDTHTASDSIEEQLDTFVSRMVTRSARLNGRTTSPAIPEPEVPNHTATKVTRVTRSTAAAAAAGRVTKSAPSPSTSSSTTNKPLPPLPAVLAPIPSTPKALTRKQASTSKSSTSLFRTLSPAQKTTRKRKLSTIKSTLKQKSVEQLTDLYNSTEDPDFQTLMTEVYHENCMSRLDEWEKSLLDE